MSNKEDHFATENVAHQQLRDRMQDLKKDTRRISSGKDPVRLASSMDGPTVPWTVNDIFKFNNQIFIAYHCMGTGYDYFSALGCALGGIVLPNTSKFSHMSRLQAAGMGGAIGGGTGMALGLFALVGKINAKDPPLPWDSDGIQTRVDGLSHNYRIRAMDLGVWLGILGAGGSVLYAGGPLRLGLSNGPVGYVQAIGIGSAVGSIVANVVIESTK